MSTVARMDVGFENDQRCFEHDVSTVSCCHLCTSVCDESISTITRMHCSAYYYPRFSSQGDRDSAHFRSTRCNKCSIDFYITFTNETKVALDTHRYSNWYDKRPNVHVAANDNIDLRSECPLRLVCPLRGHACYCQRKNREHDGFPPSEE